MTWHNKYLLWCAYRHTNKAQAFLRRLRIRLQSDDLVTEKLEGSLELTEGIVANLDNVMEINNESR